MCKPLSDGTPAGLTKVMAPAVDRTFSKLLFASRPMEHAAVRVANIGREATPSFPDDRKRGGIKSHG